MQHGNATRNKETAENSAVSLNFICLFSAIHESRSSPEEIKGVWGCCTNKTKRGPVCIACGVFYPHNALLAGFQSTSRARYSMTASSSRVTGCCHAKSPSPRPVTIFFSTAHAAASFAHGDACRMYAGSGVQI